MKQQLLNPLDDAGLIYPFRFPERENCRSMLAVPIGSSLIWQMLMCANELGYYNADLLSVPAFPKRIMEGSNTAISAIDIAVSLHGIQELLVFQSSDYHYNGASTRFTDSLREYAYHEACLIGCVHELKKRHPDLKVFLIYGDIDATHVEFYLVEESGIKRPIIRIECDCFSPCDGIIITCMDFRFWREFLSFTWNALNIFRPTVISLPGSSKTIIEGKKTAIKALKLASSVYAPGVGVVVGHHYDCGAYKEGIVGFSGDIRLEEKFHGKETSKSAEIIEGFGHSTRRIYSRCDGNIIEHVKF